MGYTRLNDVEEQYVPTNQKAYKPKQRYTLHITLFILTFISTIIAGVSWNGKNFTDVSTWDSGLTYAALIMLFISAHEFGHYFAARYHGVDATLPFYIPMPAPFLMPFGTMGAVIRTRSPIKNRKVLFDIGVSGPLAGFVVSLAVLVYGFLSLPGKEYLYDIHPEYLSLFGGDIPHFGLTFGDTLLYSFLANVFANPYGFLPPMNEIYHYPFLCVGWFGLFVTSLNLLPVGQLDGGHITYAMFGKKQGIVSRIVVAVMVAIGLFAVLGELRSYLEIDNPDSLFSFLQSIVKPILDSLYYNASWVFNGWSGWLFWAVFARFVFRLDHPHIENDEPLDSKRIIIGWIAIAIFISSISLNGIYEKSPSQHEMLKRGTVVISTQHLDVRNEPS